MKHRFRIGRSSDNTLVQLRQLFEQVYVNPHKRLIHPGNREISCSICSRKLKNIVEHGLIRIPCTGNDSGG